MVAATTEILSSLLPLLIALWLPSQPSGQPAAIDVAGRYIARDAVAAATIDWGTVGPALHQGFRGLKQESFIKDEPDVALEYARLEGRLAQGLTMLTNVIGLDPFRDIRYVTLSLSPGAKWVVAAGGSISEQAVDKLALTAGLTKHSGGNGWAYYHDASSKRPALALTKDKVLLYGSEVILRDWAKAAPKPGPAAKLLKRRYDGRGLLGAVVALQKVMSTDFARKLMPAAVGEQLRDAGQLAVVLGYDGSRVAMEVRRGKQTEQRYLGLLDGLGHYLQALEHVIRGTLRSGMALLSLESKSLERSGPRVRWLAKYRKALEPYVRSRILGTQPSHRSAVVGKGVVELDYRGSRVVASLPSFAALGYWLVVGQGQLRPSRPPPTVSVP
jgi:hypothetical protein